MSATVRYPVKKELLTWAIEESQKDPFEVNLRFKKLPEWMNGESEPTLKQLEAFANYLKVPYGYMFLQTPPRANLVQTEFRTINNAIPRISKNLQDTLVIMQRRKDWMSEYRRDNGWAKLEIIEKYNNHRNENANDPAFIKKLLELNDTWFEECASYDEAFKHLREKLENKGIMVMQNGIVEQDTKRKLEVNEFRAFALYDDVAPLIFINANDATSGKIFSLIHELIHILNEQEDVVVNQSSHNDKRNEQIINNLTADFLMPKEYMKEEWIRQKNQDNDIYKALKNMARILKVSRHALAIRLQDMRLIDSSIVAEIANETYIDKSNSSGGNYYRTYKTRMSNTFFEAVTGEVEAGRIGFTYAFNLLGGIKSKNYNRIKEMMAYE